MSCTSPRSLSVSMTLFPDGERSGEAVSLAAAPVSFDHRREKSQLTHVPPFLRTTALSNLTLVFIGPPKARQCVIQVKNRI